MACISIKYERSCCGPEIGIRRYWPAYQVIFQLLKCSLLFLLPTTRYILPTQFVVGLSKNEKYKDELSSIASKTKEALKLFHCESVVMVMFWRLVFSLSDETTWPRKVTSLLRKWHLVGFSFKPAVLLRWNTYRKQWMCSSKIWPQMMILSKYTRECVQVRPLSTRLINRVKLAGPFVNLKGITLVHLFNSFSGHEPAQRECAQTGLMRGAIPTQSHHPLRLASPRGCTTRTLF